MAISNCPDAAKLIATVLAVLGVSGCKSSEVALLGAFASGTAAEYANQKGDVAGASRMSKARDDLMAAALAMHEQEDDAGRQVQADQAAKDEAMRAGARQIGELEADRRRRELESLLREAEARRRKHASSPAQAAPTTLDSGSMDEGGLPSPDGILGVWRNEKATWYFSPDGTAKIVMPTLNQRGVATTYISWRFDESAGLLHYTITRATLQGSDGYDYDKRVSKSYTQSCRLDRGQLVINTERLHR